MEPQVYAQGVLRVSALNDLNSTSQQCINPVQITKSQKKAKIEIEDDGSYVEIDNDGKKKALTTAKISLNDCLACSGCVTSAESILIAAQSTTEFYQHLNKAQTVIVSLSPQSRASLGAYFGCTALQTHKKLVTLFKRVLGISYVFDTSFSREFALLETAAEFISRKKKEVDMPLPLLASSCPGWICYAEKTQGSNLLPYISTTKSPQQIMGTLVKYFFASKLGLKPNQVYHVTVMPCYDKKLEASREDFYNEIYKTHDVDCVLSTQEILDILKDKNLDFTTLEESPLDNIFTNVEGSDKLVGTHGGSGGYSEYIFRYAAKVLYNMEVGEVNYTTVRNSDYKEFSLEVDGQKVMTFAQMYGFKNIQNLVRRIKTGKCNYDFVEVMACPSGCLNGGGQIRSDKKETAKDLLARVESTYQQTIPKTPEENVQAMNLYKLWLVGTFVPSPRNLLHTEYHVRDQLTNPLAIKW